MAVESIIKPKRPVAGRWIRGPVPAAAYQGYPIELWFGESLELTVISAVEVAQDKDGIDRGPEYHVSISKRGHRRCSGEEAKLVLRQFDMDGAEEDNHVAYGFVRNFWRAVSEPMIGLECACKDDEPAIVEDKGDFIWRG